MKPISSTSNTALALALGAALALPAAAATLYWDVNGATNGSGDAGGIWSLADPARWSTDANGSADTSSTYFNNGDSVVFSAGTDGTGTWTIFVSGTIATPSITFEEGGTQTLQSGSLDVTAAGGLTIDSSAVADTGGNGKTLRTKIIGSGGLNLALNGDLSATGGGSDSYFNLRSTTSNFTGDVTITDGLLSWTHPNSLGDAANKIVLNGGGIVDPGLGRTTSRNIEVGTAGGTIRVFGATTSTLTGSLSSAAPTTINRTDSGTLVLQGDGSGFTGTFDLQRGDTIFESADWAGMDYFNDQTAAGNNSGFRSGTLTTVNSLTTSRNVYLYDNTGLDVDTGTVNFGQGAAFWMLNDGANTDAWLTSSSGTLTVNGGTSNTGTLATADQQIRVRIEDFDGSTPLALVKNNDNLLILNQANTHTGGTTINGGRVQTANLAAFGTGTVTVNDGGQAYLVQGGTYANDFVINGLGTTEGAGTLGAIRFQNNEISGDLSVASTSRIGGYGGAAGTLSGALLGTGDLEINGGGLTGTVNLSGDTSGYSGLLTLAAGTLNLNSGVTVGAPVISEGTLNVNSGASVTGDLLTEWPTEATINLGGAVSGSVTIDDANTLGLNGGTVGGNLALGFDGASSVDLNSSGGLAVAGDLIVRGTQLVTLNSVPAPGVPATILSYGGTSSDPDDGDVANNFDFNGIARAVTFTDTGSAITLDLGGETSKWVGNDATNPSYFDTVTPNWSSSDNLFFDGDSITFDDTASSYEVALQGPFAPFSVTFDNTTDYNVTGGGGQGFTGSTGLTKNGTGMVTLSGYSHDYTGAVNVNAGILQAGSFEALGLSSGVTVAAGARLDINGNQLGAGGSGRGYSITIDGDGGDGVGGVGAISNSGGAVYSSAGILSLTLAGDSEIGDNNGRFDIGRSEGTGSHGTIDGGGFTLTKVGTNQMVFRAPASDITYVVNGGRLTFENYDTASGTNAITVNDTATLGSYGDRAIANDVTFNAGSGLISVGGGTGTWTGTHTIAGDMNYQVDNWLIIDGALAGTGDITRNGGSVLVMQNDGAGYSGRITNNGGTLRVESASALGSYTGADWLTISGTLQAGTVAGAASGTIGSASQGIIQTNSVTYNAEAGNTLTIDSDIDGTSPATAGTADIIKPNNTGALIFNGDINTDGGLRADGGTLVISGDLLLTEAIDLRSNIVTTIGDGDDNIEAGLANNNGFKGWNGTTTINVATARLGDIELGQNPDQTHILNLVGGDVEVVTDVRVGHWPNNTSQINISAGSLSQPDTVTTPGGTGQLGEDEANLMLGIDGVGELHISGTGIVNTTSLVLDNRGNTAGDDTLTLTGGALNIGQWGIRNPNGGGTYLIELGGGTVGTTSSSSSTGYDWSDSWSSDLNMTLTGTNGDVTFDTGVNDITLSGVLSGTGGLVKEGTGSLVLDGSNTFAGTAVVNTGTLAGTGSLVGPLTVNAGGALGAGTSAAAGTAGSFQVGSSTINGAVVLDLDASDPASTGNDLVAVTGNLLFNAGSTIAPRLNGEATPGVLQTYTLMTYSGTLTGTPALDNQYYAGFRTPATNLDLGTGSNSSVTLDVTFNAASLAWSDAPANSDWDLGASANWDGASPPADEVFYQGDSVTFDSNGDNSSPINIVAEVAPGALTVDSDFDYTFQGAAITGTTGLTKNGVGTLVLTNDNSYTGPVSIDDGIVQVGDGGTSGTLGGTGDVSITGFAELAFNRADGIAPGRALVGGGLVSLDGGGSLTTVANNGVDFIVHSGTLFARGGSWNTSWSPAAVVTIESGATLDTVTHSMGGNGGATKPSEINLDAGATWFLNNEHHLASGATILAGGLITGPGELRGDGLLSHFGDITSTITTTVNLNYNITFNIDDGAQADDLLISGDVTSDGALTKDGPGTLALTGDLLSTGTLIVDDGLLALRMPTAELVISNALDGFGGTLANETGAPMTLVGDGSGFAGTIDANGQPVQLANSTAGSGSGGTLALEGATLTLGGDTTVGLLFGTFAGAALDMTPLPIDSPITTSTAALHAPIAADTTIAYDGEIYLTAGTWTFGEHVDDRAYVSIDGIQVLFNQAWDVPSSGTFTAPADGWYPFSVRVQNGGGPGGPVDNANGNWASAGIGIGIKTGGASTNVADYVPFTVGALGTSCRVGVAVETFTMAGGLTTGGGVASTVDTGDRSLIINGPIDGPDPLAKIGTGTLTLNGAGTVTGPVTVQQGTLVIGPAGLLDTASAVAVNSGATLAGTGTSGPTTVNGTLAPGPGIGTLATAGDLVFAPSSVFRAEIDSDLPSSDSVVVTGNLSIDPTTSVIFSDLGSTPLAGPLKLVLLEYSGSLSGGFAGRPEGSNVIIGANTFKLSYIDSNGPNNAVTLSLGGSAYDSWAATNITAIDPLAPAGFGDDADLDGMDNGLEWILGGDPLLQDAAGLITSSGDATTGLTLSFTREPGSLGDATLELQWDTNLDGSWTDTIVIGATSSSEANGVEVTVTPGTPDSVSVNIPAANAIDGKLFARLRASN